MNKPIYGITLFFITGITLGRYLNLPFLPLYSGSITLFAFAFIFYLKKKEKWTGYSLFILIFLAGVAYFYYSYYPRSPYHITAYIPFSEKATVIGRVVTHPELKERRIHFVLEAERIVTGEAQEQQGQEGKRKGEEESEEEQKPCRGKIWVVSYFPLQNYNYGDRIRVEGRLQIPQEPEEKEEFDWQRYLSYQGIWVELHTGKIVVLERKGGNPLTKWAYQSRNWMVKVIEHTLPRPHSAVLEGIMLGDKESLPYGVRENFLRTGTGQAVPVQSG